MSSGGRIVYFFHFLFSISVISVTLNGKKDRLDYNRLFIAVESEWCTPDAVHLLFRSTESVVFLLIVLWFVRLGIF